MISEEDNLKHIKNVKKIKNEIKKCNMTTNFNTYLLLAIIIILILFIPHVNATSEQYTIGMSNANEVTNITNMAITISSPTNISSIQSLYHYGSAVGSFATCSVTFVHSGSFSIKNTSNYTLVTGTYNENCYNVTNPFDGWKKTSTTLYTFNNDWVYAPGSLKIWYSNGWSWVNNGGTLTNSTDGNSKMILGTDLTGYYTFVYKSFSEANALTASFTAVPQSGNASLPVLFTPNIGGTNLNRAVWDYDGGLGTETKYSSLNTGFIKTYTVAGHYVARLTAFNNSGYSVTASQNIDVYNYTAGITPTPTLTPAPTPAPQTNTSLKVVVNLKNTTDSTPVNGASIGLIDVNDVGSGWFNVTANSGSYTFGGYGSGGNLPFATNHLYLFTFTKTGYKTDSVTYGGFDRDLNWYMTPIAYIPTANNFVLNLGLLSTIDNRLISSSFIGNIIISNQSSSWTTTINNPQSSTILISGLTPSSSYRIDINVEGYKSYFGYFTSSSSMAGTTQYYNAILEPAITQPSSYILTASPNQGTNNDTYNLAITGDLSNAKSITFKYQPNGGGDSYPFVVGAYQSIYQKVGGAWKIWDGSAWQASALPQSISVKFNSYSSATSYQVTAYIVSSSDVTYTTTATISIITAGQVKIRFNVWDGSASLTQIYPNTVMVYDRANSIWINKTVTSLQDISSSYFYFNANTPIQYKASAYNYLTSDLQSETLGAVDLTRDINLIPVGTLKGSNVTLFANVRDGSAGYMTIPNALITFNEGTNTSTCYTSSNGQCSIVALAPVSYSIKASGITGYSSAATTYNTTTTGNNVAYLTLMPIGVVVTNTFSPVVTGTVRVTPTFTNTSGVNTTPREEVICSTQTGNMNIYQVLMNNVACMGIEGGEAQGFVLAGLIMFVFAMGLSKYGGGVGSLGGIIIGAVIGWGMRLLPFWTLIVVMIICGLMFSKMLISSTNGS